MKEYTLSDGTLVMIKTYEEWMQDRMHMTEEEFRAELDRTACYRPEGTDDVINLYRNKYREYVDRIHLDHISLTVLEYLKAYEGHTPATFHEMCVATGLSRTDETAWLESIRQAWEQHEDNIIPF
ncbi:hypothetical protein C809_01604 [Lachnospiraceae bacterium MD335]|nr:hypothetical protein C809_01604 [Lachnospiraceae bacterium MD335]